MLLSACFRALRKTRPFVLAFLFAVTARAESARLRIVPDRNYYTDEQRAEFLVEWPKDASGHTGSARFDAAIDGRFLVHDAAIAPGGSTLVPWDPRQVPPGRHVVHCRVSRRGQTIASGEVTVRRLPPKANAVKIDLISGGLIVDGLPFFPFGFYCYSPVQPTLAEEEIVRGFNMMSPYQSNAPATLAARRKYMDRCAELGMKVHYHLLRTAGGGGVYQGTGKQQDKQDKYALLRAEVKAFRDHPALLAWYISDEPTGHGTSPAELAKIAGIIRDLDPYHPITIVFMRPRSAARYQSAMDIVMADPYPIPVRSPATVASTTLGLVKRFRHTLPVWIVPQAFGGNEWWRREPTAAEERLMTYLAVIHGATGIQYFIRHGLNGFPKSTTAWAECGAIGLEIAELTPFLLSHEPRPAVRTAPASVHCAAWRDRGAIVILAANTKNTPTSLTIEVPDCRDRNGPVRLPFENRSVVMQRGSFRDVIDAYGTRAYRIDVAPGPRPERFRIHPGNRIVNPGFENNFMPGVPAACYAGVGRGRGVTYFTDSRVALEGRHSLRMHCPTPDDYVEIRPYRMRLRQGRRYCFSVWAKGRPLPPTPAAVPAGPRKKPRRSLWQWLFGRRRKRPGDAAQTEQTGKAPGPPRFTLTVPGFDGKQSAEFTLTPDWKLYAISDRAASTRWSYVRVRLTSPGTAWFDLLQFTDDPVIDVDTPLVERTTVSISTKVPDAEIRYTLDGSPPAPDSPLYKEPFEITDSARIRACLFSNGQPVGGPMEADARKVTPRPAADVHPAEPGLRCEVYLAPPGGWKNLADFKRAPRVRVVTATIPSVNVRPREDEYGLRFTGWVRIPRSAVVRFYLTSDDGSRLLIGDEVVVDNDGLHAKREASGAAALAAGYHPITVEFFEAKEADVLELRWRFPGGEKELIPGEAFRH